MRPVHRIASLEGHHPPPAQSGELLAQLLRSQPEVARVVVGRRLDSFEPACEVPGTVALQKLRHAGVAWIDASVDRLGLGSPIRPPELLDVESRQHEAFRIAERY